MTEMMLDSGYAICFASQDIVLDMKAASKAVLQVCPKLVTASGQPLSMVDHITATVHIDQLKVRHSFIVVTSLVTPVMLETDFLQKHELTLDFTAEPVAVYLNENELSDAEIPEQVQLVWEAECATKEWGYAATLMEDQTTDVVDVFLTSGDQSRMTSQVQGEHLYFHHQGIQDLLRTTPGSTTAAQHYISLTRVPPKTYS